MWRNIFSFIVASVIASSMSAQQPATPAAQHFGAFRAEMTGLEEPSAAAVDAEGHIWIAESFAQRVRAFSVDGKVVHEIDLGARSEPSGIAIARNGAIYVSDAFDDTIKVFDGAGHPTRSFGKRGADPGDLHEPAGLCERDGALYVADTLNHRVQVFDGEGKVLRSFGKRGAGDGELNHPVDVAVDSKGDCFVADIGNERVVEFDVHGRFVRSFGGYGPYEGLFMSPSGVKVFQDRLFVADRDNHRVQVFELDGNPVYSWGVHALRPHEGGGKLHYPSQVALAADGTFAVVVEGFENRAQVFGVQDEMAEAPSGERNTAAHYAGGCSAAGDVFATLEPSGPSVQVFDLTTGTPIEITRFGTSGAKFGQLVRPFDVKFDAHGERLFVSDPFAWRISMFDVARTPGGELKFEPFLSKLVRSIDLTQVAFEPRSPWPIEPGGLAFSAQGELFVTDLANARIVVLDAKLDPLRAFGAFGDGPGQLRRPTSIALSPAGDRVYVADARCRRIVVFDRSGKELGRIGQHSEPPHLLDDTKPVFRRPYGIAVGADGSIHVSDEARDRILKLDANGFEVGQVGGIGRSGIGAGEFYKPQGLSIDAKQRLFVVDQGNHRFQILSKDGQFLDVFGARLYMNAARPKK